MSRKNGAAAIAVKPADARGADERTEKFSHDLHSRIFVILGFAELLLDEVPGKINAAQRSSLKDILDSGRRLQSLVDDYFETSAPPR